MYRKTSLALLASAATLAFVLSAAQASPVTPSASSESFVAFYDSVTNNQVGSNPCFNYSPTGGTVGCSGSVASPTTSSTMNYTSTATADYGTLKAGATATNTGANGVSNTTDYGSSVGQAYFEDSWLITGGTGTGTLELTFALDGSYNYCTPGAGLTLGFGLTNLDGGPSSSAPLLVGCSATVGKDVTLTTTFTFGTPLDFLVSLVAGADIFNLGENTSSSIDFSDTATMNAIVVTDSTGASIPFNLVAASNASLFSQLAPSAPPPPPTGVPEPWTLSLFGAGLAGATVLRRRRSRR